MNQIDTDEQELTVALERTVETAASLKISEYELVGRLLNLIHEKHYDVLPVDSNCPKKMFNGDAGP